MIRKTKTPEELLGEDIDLLTAVLARLNEDELDKIAPSDIGILAGSAVVMIGIISALAGNRMAWAIATNDPEIVEKVNEAGRMIDILMLAKRGAFRAFVEGE